METQYCPSASGGMDLCSLLAMVPCPPPNIDDHLAELYSHLESRNLTSEVVEYIADYCGVPEQTSTTLETTPTTTFSQSSTPLTTEYSTTHTQTSTEYSTTHTQTFRTSYFTNMSSTESAAATVPEKEYVPVAVIVGVCFAVALACVISVVVAHLFFKRRRKTIAIKGREKTSLRQIKATSFVLSTETHITHITSGFETRTNETTETISVNFAIGNCGQTHCSNSDIFGHENEDGILSMLFDGHQFGETESIDACYLQFDEPDSDEEYDTQLQRYIEML